MVEWVFNPALLLVDVACFALLRSKPTAWRLVVFLALQQAASLFLAVVVGIGGGWGGFGVLRLLAWGVFLHAPLLAAAVLRPAWRGRLRSSVGVALGLVLGLPAVAGWSFLVEPFWLEVTHLEVEAPGLSKPVRLALVADIQTDAIGDYEVAFFERLIEEEPDYVLLAGDYIHGNREVFQGNAPRFRALFQEACARAGFEGVAVEGNCDWPDWPDLFEGACVQTVRESGELQLGELAITALGMQDSAYPRISVPAREGFHIVIGHHPDFALGDVQADLLLAGHTHGGQVRLPFFGPPLTLSRIPRSWAAGRTELEDGKTLVVSRGIGMERSHAPELRFLCRPELVILDLIPSPD